MMQTRHASTEQLVSEARALLGSPQIKDAHLACFELPHLRLEVSSSMTSYIAMCQRALINLKTNAQRSTHAPRTLRITVADAQHHPEFSKPLFDTPTVGLGKITQALEAAELDGCPDHEHGSWQFLSWAEHHGLQLLSEPDRMPPWEAAFPLRHFLHWHYAHQGRRLLHAGTLGWQGQGVLLAGAGGAGKSGTTLAGILGGLSSVGDDYIGLDPLLSQPTVFPVMRLMKQDAKGLQRLGLDPQTAQFGLPNWQGKYEFDVESICPESRAEQLQLKAVLLPHITGAAQSQLRPATQHEVLFALLPNNLQQLPGHAAQGMRVLTDLTRRLPGYHLNLSTDPQEITHTIRTFIETHSS